MPKIQLPPSKWDMPPIEKIHEALSAVSDGRVEMFDGNALIASSDYSKKYTIEWSSNIYKSNDNASYWQGYLGYPVIAVLLLQKKLPLDETIADYFKGINWKDLNTKCKNKYSKVVALILEDMSAKGIDVSRVNDYIQSVYEEIKNLDILYQRSSLPPPK